MKKRLKESSDASITVSKTPPDSPTVSAADDTKSRARKLSKAPVSDTKTLRATLDRARELEAKAQRRTEEKKDAAVAAEEEQEESVQRDTGIQDRLVKKQVDIMAPLAHKH